LFGSKWPLKEMVVAFGDKPCVLDPAEHARTAQLLTFTCALSDLANIEKYQERLQHLQFR
jgi:hypothetical protein